MNKKSSGRRGRRSRSAAFKAKGHSDATRSARANDGFIRQGPQPVPAGPDA
jgi:hypothetical protein